MSGASIDTPKTPAGQRALPLGHLAARITPLVGGPDDFLFRQPAGEPYTELALYHRLRAAMEAVGLYHQGNAWHAFRRLHATLMRSHKSLFDRRAQMGQATIQTTQRYVAPDLAARLEAVKAVQGTGMIQ